VKPFVIAIAGPSGSGKTEVASRLVEALENRDAIRIALDHYYKDLAGLDAALRGDRNFDHPDALDHGLLVTQLRALAAGEEVEMPIYRFETHTRAPEGRPVRSGEVMVIDGLYALYWTEVRELVHLPVFIDADHATCLARRLARDVRERGRTEASVRAQYELTVRPMYDRHVAPTRRFSRLLLSGTSSASDQAAEILAHARHVWSAGGGLG
jgi:uridine kinase